VRILRQRDGLTITVESTGLLRTSLADLPERIRSLDLTVTDWVRPWSGWSGRLGPLPGLLRQEIGLPEGERGSATVTVTLSEPTATYAIVAAVLNVLEPARAMPAPVALDVATRGRTPGWFPPGGSSLRLAGQTLSDDVVRPYDAELTGPVPVNERGYGQRLTASAYGVITGGGDERVLVDATTANPRGRQRFGPELPAGRLFLAPAGDGVGWQIRRAAGEPATVVAGRVGDPLDARQAAALVRLRSVEFADPSADIPPAAQAAAIAQLAMTGVVLNVPALPGAAAALLSPEVVSLAASPLPDPAADALDWEMRSVAQRRAALRHHATALALPRIAAVEYPSLARPPAVSALLVTRRPRLVAAAVAAMAAQSYPELEIIVALHGCDMADADRAPLADLGVPVQVVNVAVELSFGEALGAATRWARGSLITKVDDDDRYGPEHVWDLVLARHYSGATVVGKGAEFVYLEARDLTVRRRMGSELYSDVVAGGTILLSRGDLEAVGGWRPLHRSVDRGLLDRILNAGGLIYRAHGLGFIYSRHSDGHTWDPGLDYFLHDPLRRWTGLPRYEEFGTR
jgi:hypothetical protein